MLTITQQKTPLVYPYHMGAQELYGVDKDLGIPVSASCRWDAYIYTIIRKAKKMLRLLKRTCPLLRDKCVRRTLYLSFVTPQLCYSSEVWSLHTIKLKARVESVQRGATAWILNFNYGELKYQKQRLISLSMLPLCYEREISDLVFFQGTSW